MAKPSDCNYLKGLIRQIRWALDEGDQLAYELAELLVELDDLIAGPDPDGPDDGDGAHVDAVGGSVGDGSPHPSQDSGARLGGSQDPQLHVPGLARGVDRVLDTVHSDSSVPRGTGSGPSATVKRRPRAT